MSHATADQTARRDRGLWMAALALFVGCFVVAHQRFGATHDITAYTSLIGGLFVWLGVLPWLAFWWIAAAGYGVTVCRPLGIPKQPALQIALGGAVLMILTWLIAWLWTLHVAAMATVLSLGFLLLLFATRCVWLDLLRRPKRVERCRTPRPPQHWPWRVPRRWRCWPWPSRCPPGRCGPPRPTATTCLVTTSICLGNGSPRVP